MYDIPLLTRESLEGLRAVGGGFRVPGRDGILRRVRPGVYADDDLWNTAAPEARVVARARALQVQSSTVPIVSHESAGAVHGLPLYQSDPHRTHVTVADGRPGAARETVRHRGELRDDEVTRVRGLHVTTLERTVADVARTATFEQAVVIADAALRMRCGRPDHRYDEDHARAFVADVLAIARRSAHGLGRAERVLAFADGRAQLPGESISRVRIRELGFRRIRLQVPVIAPDGVSVYLVDVAFDDPGVAALGEFDGLIKYVDGRMRDGRSAGEVYDDEKRREDWIRGRTQRRMARWGWPHLRTSRALGERLAAFGIVPPR